MTERKLAPGDIVDARCTRCRTVTNHTIVAMVETRIARVQCNTCGGTHNYHAPKPAAAAAGGRPAPEKKARGAKGRADAEFSAWQECCSSVDPAQAIPYAMDRPFRVGEKVAHPAFGVGMVTGLVQPDKAEILFREGRKLLRCGRLPANPDLK